jgi:hypothetical protein
MSIRSRFRFLGRPFLCSLLSPPWISEGIKEKVFSFDA